MLRYVANGLWNQPSVIQLKILLLDLKNNNSILSVVIVAGHVSTHSSQLVLV